MSTPDERITIVERDLKQFKTETVRAYQNMAHELGMLKGLTLDNIKRITELKVTVDERFNTVDERFNTVDERFDRVDTRLDRLEMLLAQVLERLPKPTE